MGPTPPLVLSASYTPVSGAKRSPTSRSGGWLSTSSCAGCFASTWRSWLWKLLLQSAADATRSWSVHLRGHVCPTRPRSTCGTVIPTVHPSARVPLHDALLHCGVRAALLAVTGYPGDLHARGPG